MKHLSLSVLLTVLLSLSTQAQNYTETDSGIELTVNSVYINIQFFDASMVRVVKYPEGETFNKQSLSVIKEAESTDFSVSEENNSVVLNSGNLKVTVDQQTGQVSFFNLDGTPLLKEKAGGVHFEDFNDAGEQTYSITQSFTLDEDEAVYGLGQLYQGNMSQRGVEVSMVQNNTEDFTSYMHSIKGYGLFWDNYSPTIFKDTQSETSFISEVGEGVDYYFMYGGNADGVVGKMRELTGQAPMFPLWTFGYWQSRERYRTQDQTVGVVQQYRDLGVPLDGIIQDWQYWGNNYLWNAMEFLNVDFYDPEKMVDDIHDLNAHIIISIWSSFGPETKQYKELSEKGMLMDFSTWPQSGSQKWPPRMDYPSGVQVYDAYHPEARDIYWKYLKNGLYSVGIDGWWMDSTEPDHLDQKEEDLDNQTYLGSFRKVRNAYPLMTVGGVYKHQRELTSDKRVFILTRSAFAGQQRYGAQTWSGDIVASWDALHAQIAAGLNFSLTGIPYWNSDIGGFFLWDYPNPLDDPEYRELYVRWLQFGALTPMMRSHGTNAPREIYQFGEPGDPEYDAIEKFINLRYRLLPYMYSTSWQVTNNHSTMMRALMMDFADDKNVHDLNDEYMFGKSILVAPVTSPMYFKEEVQGTDTVNVRDLSTIKSEEVYLPAGTEWYDFWTGEKHAGGITIEKDTPLDIMPLYLKAGSILPIGPDVQYAEEKEWDELEVRIYTGEDGEFVLYEDEFDNYNYEEGKYSTIVFNWDDSEQKLTIDEREGSFPGMIEERTFNIVLVDSESGTGMEYATEYDRSVMYKGSKAIVTF
ncbi:MAG: xylosidase [Balneola sp.]|nr:xylosidase [Balneola sp.]|tara:strand:- start:58592 stop:61009 length:2418 start_codon:yes stop_codon:yes gene_type:complete